jgi:hypothetical protein
MLNPSGKIGWVFLCGVVYLPYLDIQQFHVPQYCMNIGLSAIMIAFSLLIAGRAAGQPLTSRTIASQADSMLRAYIGDSLFAHCTRTGTITISYTSRNENWVRRSGILAGPDSIITEVLIDAIVSYKFSMWYELCPDLDTIHGELEIILDGPAMSFRPPDIRFIPEMVLSNLQCYFISRKKALEIALREKGMAGGPHSARLFYDSQEKRYLWEITQMTDRRALLINAVNGVVISVGIPETSIRDVGGKK